MRTLTLALSIAALALTACNSNSSSSPNSSSSDSAQTDDKAAPGMVSRSGMLRSGMMAVGGETTGWMLIIDGREPLEVDVNKVFSAAQRNVNKRVTITGKLTSKQYVERGKTTILAATSIEPAK